MLFRGEIDISGKVVGMLEPKWRLHYLAHLDRLDASLGQPVRPGSTLGAVGETGNVRGKPPHLHYSIVTLLPYPWRIDASTQGWKKMCSTSTRIGFSEATDRAAGHSDHAWGLGCSRCMTETAA